LALVSALWAYISIAGNQPHQGAAEEMLLVILRIVTWKMRDQETFDERASKAPHLTSTAEAVHCEVVIPTYRRWRSTQEVTKKKRFKDSSQPFILDHTLGFLSREGVPKERVTLFVANEEEMTEYRKALEGSEWSDVRIQVSVPGVRDSRNFIYKFFPADTYVVSLDDDMEGITWKVREGGTSSCCVDLPSGNFVKIINDAYQRMKETGAFLWGLSTSQNPRFLVLDDVSTRNGLVNGYLHGFICRPEKAPDLLRRLPDSVEDAEFSVRHFAKDKVVLRYRMYAGVTSPYTNSGGLQSKFHAGTGSIRKSEEWCGAQQLHELFPTLIAAPSDSQTCRQYATEVRFISQTSLGIKARRFAVRRLQGLCRFMLPQLKGKGKGKSEKRKTPLAALARLKAFAIRKKPKKELPKSGEKSGEKSERIKGKPQAERPLPLLGDDRIRFAANPKKKGTDAHQRYAKYCRAKKVKDLATLGCKNIDLRYDMKGGYLKVVELETRPASSECVVEDDAPSGMPSISGRARSVPVRLAEATGKHPGLYLSKEALLPLLNRCPALKGSWSLCAAKAGPLSKVSLPCFRILLHWTKTSRLIFAHHAAAELLQALQGLGAMETAERLRERMNKQEIKFNVMSAEGPPAEEFPALDIGKTPTESKTRKRKRREPKPTPTLPSSRRLSFSITATAKDMVKESVALPGEKDEKNSPSIHWSGETSLSEAPLGVTTKSLKEDANRQKEESSQPKMEHEPMSTSETASMDIPVRENPSEQEKTNLAESGTKIQPEEHVTLVLGNQRHRQKNLRSMFASRSGGS